MTQDNQLATWYNGIPQFTRYWFTAAVVLPMSGRLGILDLNNFVLVPQLVWQKFHIWRLFSCLFVAEPSFNYLMLLYFLYQYCRRLEEADYQGKPADMAYMLMVLFSTTIAVGLVMNMGVLFKVPIIAVIYVWCNLNKDQIVPFYFGLKVPAQYLPWVLCLFSMVVGGSGMTELLGIFVGHVYYFFKFRYAQDFGGPDLLETPMWLKRHFPTHRTSGGFGAPPTRPEPSTAGASRWSAFQGRGNRLGE